MRKILKYTVETGRTAADLVGNVNGMIECGFEPFGSVAVALCTEGGGDEYAQAMVRYEDEEPSDGDS